MLSLGALSLRSLQQLGLIATKSHRFIMPAITATGAPQQAPRASEFREQSRSVQGGTATRQQASSSSPKVTSARKFYAIRNGLETGVFESPWDSIKHLVTGVKGSEYKGFSDKKQAEAWLRHETFQAPAEDRNTAIVPNTTVGTAGRATSGTASSRAYRSGSLSSTPQAAAEAHARNSAPQLVEGQVRATTSSGWLDQSIRLSGKAAGQDTALASPAAGAVTAYHLTPGLQGGRLRPSHVYRLYFDGGSRCNPGFAGYGAVVTEAATGHEVCHIAGYLPFGFSNNDAEYTALAEGVRIARQLGATQLQLRGDSELVVRQLTGEYRYSLSMRSHVQRVSSLLRGVRHDLQHVPREQNRVADALSNLGMDVCEIVQNCIANLDQDEVTSMLSALEASSGGANSGPQIWRQLWEEESEEEGLRTLLLLQGVMGIEPSKRFRDAFVPQVPGADPEPSWEMPLRRSLVATALRKRLKQLAPVQPQASRPTAEPSPTLSSTEQRQEPSFRHGPPADQPSQAPPQQRRRAAQADGSSPVQSSSATGSVTGSRARGSSKKSATDKPETQPGSSSGKGFGPPASAASKPGTSAKAATPAAAATTGPVAAAGGRKRGRPRKVADAVQDGR